MTARQHTEERNTTRKYIFVVGGVMSSVGKGIATASIGKILQARGYKVSLVKCDMYVNIDAGTIRPTEHGEVFVGEDGIEADQDLGNYERFTDQTSTALHYLTTGQVYAEVIKRERNLEYGGEDVEVVPDIPNEIIRRIKLAGETDQSDFVVIEIGGTVGEYQNVLFLEAGRMMKARHKNDVLFVLVSYLPIPGKVGEMKTKPTQYAARTLNATGIQADFILCRSEHMIDEKRREKLALFCNIEPEDAIAAPDVDSIYDVPVNFARDGLDLRILQKFGLEPKADNLGQWSALAEKIKTLTDTVSIGVVGKYFNTGDFTLADSYISVLESIKHAAWEAGVKPKISWLDAEAYEKDPSKLSELSGYDGIIVPGGFGSRGVEGKILAVEYVRKNNIPYLGLCYGLQMAVIEYARNVCGLADANTTEVNKDTPHPVIDVMVDQKANIAEKKMGGTMRLGAYPCELKDGTISREAYGKKNISERHRHRYEVNNEYRAQLEEAGLVIAGRNPDRDLVEIIELPQSKHPFFVGVQFHPEFLSRPLAPHPLFMAFIKAATKTK
ncbi:CTP synthase [Candidatus Kaiserbacteria bacterium]|nr:CTP synthase [Candidatus Kaiserbacteria bacterium]